MRVQTTHWDQRAGWSNPLPPWDGPRTLVLVFGGSRTTQLHHDPLSEVLAAFPHSIVTGCSTAGEIIDDAVYRDTLAVAIMRFDTTNLRQAHEFIAAPEQSYEVGQRLAQRLVADNPEVRGLFVLSDGVRVNGSTLVSGLTDGSDGTLLISGGLAADGELFERTWVIVDGEPQPGYVNVIAFAGPDIHIGHGSRGGWDIFGPERRVTKSTGNVLYELDGQPALQLYKSYLGERASELPASALLFPLAIRLSGGENRQLVRTIVALNEDDQSLTFAGDIPEGSLAQLMRANLDRIIDGAHLAARETGIGSAPPTLAVTISCFGRRLLLGRRTEDEIEAVRAALGDQVDLIGFYSYGEISSVAPGACDLHNQTMTITTFWETTTADG